MIDDDQSWDDDESDFLPCSECGQDIYEDSVRCPHCGNYITADTRSTSRLFSQPAVVLISIVLILALIAIVALAGGR